MLDLIFEMASLEFWVVLLVLGMVYLALIESMNFLILNSVNLGQGFPQNLKKNILLLVVFPSENILNIWTQIFDSHLLR